MDLLPGIDTEAVNGRVQYGAAQVLSTDSA